MCMSIPIDNKYFKLDRSVKYIEQGSEVDDHKTIEKLPKKICKYAIINDKKLL